MNRIVLLAALTALITGCHADARTMTAPSEPSLSASTFTSVAFVPVDLSVFVPCADGGAGEDVVLSGSLQVLSHTVADGAGGFRVISHSNPQGVSGVGLSTGTRYRGVGVTHESFGGGPGFTLAYVNSFQVIGSGPRNNFMVHQTTHLTVNANGVVTAIGEQLRIECR